MPRVFVACLAGILALACYEPVDQRPGLRLSGEVVDGFPDDWSFSDAYPEIAVEVETPYLIPHSVTIWCATLDGDLYIGARDAETKSWPAWAEDGGVRLKIGDEIYAGLVERIEDEGHLARIRAAYGKKYQLGDRGGAPPKVRYWAVRPEAS